MAPLSNQVSGIIGSGAGKQERGYDLQGLRRIVQLIRQQKFKTNDFFLFLCQQLAFLSEKLIL